MAQSVDFASPGVPPPAASARRGWVLRLTLFAAVLGAILSVVDSEFIATYDPFAVHLGIPATVFHQLIVPILALVAVTGALILERQPLAGMFLLLGATLLSLGGSATYLAPAAVLGCFWAQRRVPAARTALGYILLLPGVVTVYYGLAALLSYASRQAMPGMPPGLDPPDSLRQALLPLIFLPVALLGAWLLAERNAPRN